MTIEADVDISQSIDFQELTNFTSTYPQFASSFASSRGESIEKEEPIEIEYVVIDPYLKLSRVSQLGTFDIVSEKIMFIEVLEKIFLSRRLEED